MAAAARLRRRRRGRERRRSPPRSGPIAALAPRRPQGLGHRRRPQRRSLPAGPRPPALGLRLMLHPLDLVVILAYLAAITAFGVWLPQPSLRDYFLAGGELPWWAISFSIVAAETSVLTIISTPGLAFGGDLGFLQLVFGYLVARILIALILIPAYFRGQLLTAYQLLAQRFGERAKTLAALIFLVGRSLAEGVRVYAVAIVIEVIL